MKEKFWFGSAPADEKPAQIGSPDFVEQSSKECNAFVAMIYRFLAAEGNPKDSLPEGFKVHVELQNHDFGVYREVVCTYPSDDPQAEKCKELALLIDWHCPSEWDPIARKELGLDPQ